MVDWNGDRMGHGQKLQQPFGMCNSPVAQSDSGCLAGDKDGGFHEVFDKTLREASFPTQIAGKASEV